MKDQPQYWVETEKPYRFVTPKEFAEVFESFHVGRSLGNELLTQFDKSKSHPAALTTNKYGIGKRELFKACLSRELLLMKRNSTLYKFKLCQVGFHNLNIIVFHFMYKLCTCYSITNAFLLL
jgi:hypothetical protein